MKKGFIYFIIDKIVEKLIYLNLVEGFKAIAIKCYPKDKIIASRAGVDLFILLKWLILILFWFNDVKNQYVNYIVWYLILSNIFTYFYYHTWTKDLAQPLFSLDRVKRRFLSLLLAVAYNIFSFAYLIAQPFSGNFKWVNKTPNLSDSILYSIANSLITNFDPVKAISYEGHVLALIETITSFTFLTIILSNSIPQIKSD